MKKINNNFWKNKKILITGHTGFKGRWLTIILKILGSKVFGISLNEKNNFEKKEYINFLTKKNSFFLDIKKRKKVEKVILKINPEIIIHMAAQSKVIDGYHNPIETFETNIMGTINILNASVKLKELKAILVVTTDKVYKNNEKKIKFSENDKLGGDDPYSTSKASAEIILDYYRKFNPKIKIISVRAGNIIGGGDFAKNRIIPDLVKAWKSKKKLIIRNPKSTRPWQYILDVLISYMNIIELSCKKKKIDLSFNIGPFLTNLSVIELVLKIKKHFNDLKLIIKKNNSILEKKYLNLDIKRSIKLLGLKNNINMNVRIESTANLYKEILNSKNVNHMEQIYKKEITNFLSNTHE